MCIVDSRFFPLSPPLIRIFFEQAASLFPFIHTFLPSLPVYNDTARIFLFTFRNLRGNGEYSTANIPLSLASPLFIFLSVPLSRIAPSIFHFTSLSLSLSLWVVHTVIASLLKFKRDSSRPIRTFPVIHPCYLIPSLLICTECWDLLLVARRARREKRGSELNLCSELARQFAPYISRYTGQMDCRIFTVSGMASMDIICR